MKKKIAVLILALVLVFSSAVFSFGVDKTAAIQMLGALGIMRGDQYGNLYLDEDISRAEFAAMMVLASSYKDGISPDGTGYSLYKDVKSNHWASEYIRLATDLGWVSGFSDGSFLPDETITLEEACCGAIKLLGYSSSDVVGSYPYAYLNKASELGLRKNLNRVKGEEMKREDCMYLFCNLLSAKSKTGMIYGQSLGYSIVNGEVDYASVILENMSGPYIAEGGETLDFNLRTVYINGEEAESFSLNPYDVYYYNEGIRTAWIYTTKVSGKITALSPSASSPSMVSMGTSSYSLGTAAAKYQVTALGGGGVGKTVTLLLGMDDAVVGCITGKEFSTNYIGVVQSCVQGVSSSGNAKVETTLRLYCTDGIERSFALSGSTEYKTGKLVSVSVSGNSVSAKSLSEQSLSGKISVDGKKFGDKEFAANVNIIDSIDAKCIKVSVDRLAGFTLASSAVRYYTLDAQGRITNLILKDATGDMWSYGMLLSAFDNNAYVMTPSGINISYTMLLDGMPKTYISTSFDFGVEAGGIGVKLAADGSLASVKQLEEIKLDTISALKASSGSTQYSVDPGVSVYLKKGDSYYSVSLSQINDADYRLTGYKDAYSVKATGLIRVIVAEEK